MREFSSNLLSLMFPDGEIVPHSLMKQDKLAYVISFGFAPFFQDELLSEPKNKKTSMYTIYFDESLNKVCPKSQMHVISSFWD